MYALTEQSQSSVTLHVADVQRSRCFYEDLLGLSPSDQPASEGGVVLSGFDAGVIDLKIELRPRLNEEEPHQSVWLSVEVDSITEVLDLYLLAVMLGAKALLPRRRGSRWNTVILDPDGYQISVWTHVPRDAGDEAPLQQQTDRRVRWEHSGAARKGYDARAGRSTDAADHRRRMAGLRSDEPAERRSFTDVPPGSRRSPGGKGA